MTDAAELAARLLAHDRDAVPLALNLVDDRRAGPCAAAAELLVVLERAATASAVRVGLTGAPGAGKSTLLDALVRKLRVRGETVGVVAVDPSSRRTGGALLGDRVRVRASAGDPGVFFRSMAARDQLGGLAEGTRAAAIILSAVFDSVIIETVGVGQSESEVSHLVDSLVFVAQPGAGDLLQFMKAGVLELPDIFVVNKSDLGATAERTRGELLAGLGLAERRDVEWTTPVVLVSARDGAGVDELLGALTAHRAHLEAQGRWAARRAAGRDAYVVDALLRRYGNYGVEAVGGLGALRERLSAAPDEPGFGLALELGRSIEEALCKPVGSR